MMNDFLKIRRVMMIAGGVLFVVVLAAVVAIFASGGKAEEETEGSGEFVEIRTELGEGWWREAEPIDD